MLGIGNLRLSGIEAIYKKMSKKNNNLDSLIEESLDNVRQDRAIASTLLVDLVTHIKGNKHEHKETGQVAAKYLETLQRSNEQLVKIINLKQKGTTGTVELNEKEKDELFDMIQGEIK